ncbi:MAG: hypothetical protein HKN79_10015 [Flavobacteriales bacterium]|nr:hypothetical protein [Flavobacteriales bacterium]
MQLKTLIESRSKEAFDHLYEKYASSLMGIAMRAVSDRATAQEIVHDTYLKIWNKKNFNEFEHRRAFSCMAGISQEIISEKNRTHGINEF